MDPNATLAALRLLVEDFDSGNIHDQLVAVEQLTSHFDNLDTWITRGGFLPDAWAQAPTNSDSL